MLTLKNLQQSFRQHLINGDNKVLPEIISTADFSNIERLAIYGNAYFARFYEVLSEDYEAIHTLLGDDQFTQLCHLYIDAYPSQFYTLRWFGKFMADFLRANAPYAEHEYLYEMARFEWLFTDAFDAKDEAVISESDVAGVPADKWPQLRVKLHPSVHWFEYGWNILPVWKAIKENTEVPVLKKLDCTEKCLIWRQALTTKYRTLNDKESQLLNAAAKSQNFSQWCELLIELGDSPEDVPMLTAGMLKSWINLGLISEINY